MDLFEIQDNSLIICNNDIKKILLLKLSKLNKLLNLKFMSKLEFFEHYFFSYDINTIYYVMKKYNVTKEIACIYLDNLKYVINVDLNDSKIIFLKKLYNELNDNNLLIYSPLFKNFLIKQKIIVIDDFLDDFIINLLNNYDTKYLNIYKIRRKNNLIYHFKTIELEVEYAFNKVSDLLKNKVSLNNIKFVLLGNEYLSVVKRLSNLYNIKFNNLEKYSIYGLVETKEFITIIKELKTQEAITNKLKELNLSLNNDYFNIINKYFMFDDLSLVIDLIIIDLKNTYLKEKKNINAIDIIPLNSLLVDDDYVFVLGMNNENIPKTHKDIDYFCDSLKSKLGLNTSIKKNKLECSYCINNINNIENIYLSYKDSTPNDTYLKSNLITDLNLDIIDDYLDNNSSNLYNKIKLTNYLDILLKYNVIDSNLSKLYNTYSDIKYLTYDNSFKLINNFSLDKLTLSYSSLDNYYKCSFKYYIENILKLNIYEETFKQFIGNLFHDILSHIYEKDFDYLKYFDNYIKDKGLNNKELFYLTNLKSDLKNIIEVIKYQYNLTGLNNYLLENRIKIDFNKNISLVGIIDKILYKEKDGFTYVSIIDYKTGNFSLNIDNLKYGLDMQLPIYLYLINHSNIFKNPYVIGFYLEKILHDKAKYCLDLNKQTLDDLKLQGYSINDNYLVSLIDSSYEDSNMIKNMKVTKNGFSHYAKVLSKEEMDKIDSLVDLKIKEGINSILRGSFSINPKILNGENISCKYCKYSDLCYKTYNDYIYLKDNEINK